MKYVGLKKWPAFALALTFALTPAASAQAPAGGVTKEEEAEARSAAAAFAARLQESRDFAAVRELYADDFMSRQLKGLSDWAEGMGSKTFMFEGVPSLTFDRSLASKAGVEDWERVRFAADDLMYYMFLSLLAHHRLEDLDDPEKIDQRAILGVVPPEAVRVLDANPAAANFLLKKRSEVVTKTPEELRALAATLEEAVRLTRPRLAGSLAKGRHLDANLRLFAEGVSGVKVEPAEGEEVIAGYPEGTRLFRVLAPNGYSLRLVRQGGAMKIVWAGMPSD